jgi:hypothetical protein
MGSVEVRSWPPHLRQSQARRNHSAASWLPSQERKTIQPDAPGAATAVTGQANARSERSAPACFERGGREPSAPTGDGREGATGWKRDREAHGGIAAGLESSRGVMPVQNGPPGRLRAPAAVPQPPFGRQARPSLGQTVPPPSMGAPAASDLLRRQPSAARSSAYIPVRLRRGRLGFLALGPTAPERPFLRFAPEGKPERKELKLSWTAMPRSTSCPCG